MNPKPSSSPLPGAFLPMDRIGQIQELSMVSPEFPEDEANIIKLQRELSLVSPELRIVEL